MNFKDNNYNFNSIILPSINDKTNTDNLLRKIEEVSKNNDVICTTSGRFELIKDLKIQTIKIPNIFTEILNKNKEVSQSELSEINCDEDEIIKIIDKAK